MGALLKTQKALIVGAGPSGLACALAMASQGIQTIIIDKRPERGLFEKATGVSLGSWQLLKPFGISRPTEAIPMKNFIFYDDEKLVANVPVPLVNGHPPAHLFPQAELERLIENALLSAGVEVQYGTSLSSLIDTGTEVKAELVATCGSIQQLSVNWLIGADGAHSRVRQLCNIDFKGVDYPEIWSVAEISTDEWDASAQARLYLQSRGVGLFLSQPSPGIVQGILNAPGAGHELLKRFKSATLKYEREFKSGVKRVASPRVGNVWLIGDAAHTQSPVGGQGLNLAIWDGITLGNNITYKNYHTEKLLAQKARKILMFTHFDYSVLSTKSAILRSARNAYWTLAAKYPLIAHWFFKIISGK